MQLSVPGQDTMSVISCAPRAAEADVAQSLPDFVQSVLRHPAECEVLLVRDARPPAGVFARHVGELMELPAVDVAERQANRDGLVAVLSLRLHIALHPVLEFRIAAECGVTAVERGARQRISSLNKHEVRWGRMSAAPKAAGFPLRAPS